MYTKRPFQEHFYTFSLFVFPRILHTTINAAEYKNLPVSFHSIYGIGVASAPIRICNEIGRPAFAMPLWRGQWSLVFPRNFSFFCNSYIQRLSIPNRVVCFNSRIAILFPVRANSIRCTKEGPNRNFYPPLLFVKTAVEVVKSATQKEEEESLSLPAAKMPRADWQSSEGKRRENIFESSSSNSSRTCFPFFFFRVAVASRIRMGGRCEWKNSASTDEWLSFGCR